MQLRLLFCFCINLYEIHRLTNVFSECRIPCRGACCPGLKHLGRPHLMKKRSSHFNINQAQSEWHALDRHPLVIWSVSSENNLQMHPAYTKELGGGICSIQIKYKTKMNQLKMRSNRIGVLVNVARTTLGGGSSSGAPPPGGHTRRGTTSRRGSSPRSRCTRCPTPPSWSTGTRPRSTTLGGVSVSKEKIVIGSEDDG